MTGFIENTYGRRTQMTRKNMIQWIWGNYGAKINTIAAQVETSK